jgi:hypothetical protein
MPLIDPSAVPQALRVRLVSAFVGLQGPIPLDPVTGLPTMTPAQFAQSKIMAYVLSVVKQWEAVESLKPTQTSINNAIVQVDTDFQNV